jgi:hypothetical protein
MLLLLVFSPCLIGCSSQMSEEEAERLEAEQEAGEESYEIPDEATGDDEE